MKIACIQFEPMPGEMEENIRHAAELVRDAGAEIAVLPELATSGYLFPSKEAAAAVAEKPAEAVSVDAIRAAARDAGSIAVVYGFVERAAGRLYNSAAIVTPDGLRHVYRKIHLFSTEKAIFEPGDRPFEVVDLGAVRLGVMICFDWIYPESARSLALGGADIICHSANLVLPYCQDAMITRSIENRVFTATANRIGTETCGELTLTFTGKSQITSPHGERLASAGMDTEEIITAEIDPALARDKKVTPENDLLADRRPGMYINHGTAGAGNLYPEGIKGTECTEKNEE
jgi:predicted amidohydrolase